MSRFIVDPVGLLEERHFGYNWRGSGSEQYPPRTMLALLICSYADRIFSSRRIERATYRDIAVRCITADTHPDHDTIAKLVPGKKGGYHTAYNTQLAVQAVRNHPQTQRVLADTGHDNAAQIHRIEHAHRVIVYCPPEKSGREPKPDMRESSARRRTKEFREGMKACMRSGLGRRSQALRATTVEPVFSWIKNTLGFRRFQLRGMGKVRLEWELVCLVHNLTLLHRVTRTRHACHPS